MSRPRNDKRSGGRQERRPRPNGAGGAQHRIPLTPEGIPAAVPDAPPTSAVVVVSDETRARHPWLPRRVIAWSVWRGPDHVRIRIDDRGNAVPCGARPVLAG